MKEKTAVAVLRNLNLRVGEVQPQLDGALRKAFQTRYAKMPNFQLYGTAYEFVYEEKRIRLRIELTVDFGVFFATAGIVRKVSAGISVGEEGWVLNRVSRKAGSFASSVVQELPLCAPSLEKIRNGNGGVFQAAQAKPVERIIRERPFADHFQDLAAHVLPDLEEMVLDKVREYLAGKQRSLSSPAPWVVPCQPVACRLEANIEDGSLLVLRCAVELRWWQTGMDNVTVKGPRVYNEALQLSEEKLDRFLADSLRSLASTAGNRICENVIPFQVVPPEASGAGEGFPRELWDFLRRNTLGTKSCEILLQLPSAGLPSKDAPATAVGEDLFLGQMKPYIFVRILKGQRSGRFALGVDDFLSSEDPLSGAIRPVTLGGTLRVAQALAEVYDRAEFGEVSKPPLTLVIAGERLTEIRWMKQSLPIQKAEQVHLEENPRAFAEELPARVRQYVWELGHKEDGARRIVSSLNPTVLTILQHICRERRCYSYQLRAGFGSSLPTTKISLERYVDLAAEVKVPVNGCMVHVVRRSTNPAMHDRLDFQSLYPQLKDIILTAHPAPYALEDYPYLRPSARTAELEARAAQADTREARWALLEILEKGMPKTAAADFVKSEAGQAFLRELEGDDREYARLFLEELPGCKRLVGSLLGSGSQEPTK